MTSPPGGPPLPPPLPIAKRLNRNALTVAAVLMGITVLVAVVTLNGKRSESGVQTGADAASIPTPAQPSFLDLPTRRAVVTSPAPPTTPPLFDTTTPTQPSTGSRATVTSNADPYAALLAKRIQPDPTVEAYRRALASPVVRDSVPKMTLAPARSASLDSTATPMVTSSHRLDAGTIIPAALMQAVNSDLPGQLVAQVTRNVYDSRTQHTVLIPQGTKLIGRYDAKVTTGQNRLQIAWTRMIFPDKHSLAVPDADGADGRGASGVPGNVDHHDGRVFGTALLTSVISAAVQLSQPRQSSSPFEIPGAGQVAAGALGQQLSEVGLEMLRRNLNVHPTITLPEGAAINVLLNGDLDLPEQP